MERKQTADAQGYSGWNGSKQPMQKYVMSKCVMPNATWSSVREFWMLKGTVGGTEARASCTRREAFGTHRETSFALTRLTIGMRTTDAVRRYQLSVDPMRLTRLCGSGRCGESHCNEVHARRCWVRTITRGWPPSTLCGSCVHRRTI